MREREREGGGKGGEKGVAVEARSRVEETPKLDGYRARIVGGFYPFIVNSRVRFSLERYLKRLPRLVLLDQE